MKLCEQQTQAEEAVKTEGAILTRCSCASTGALGEAGKPSSGREAGRPESCNNKPKQDTGKLGRKPRENKIDHQS